MTRIAPFGQRHGRTVGFRIMLVPIPLLQCVECESTSNEPAGWRVARVDDPEDEDTRPELGWYCPRCVRREFFEPA